MIAKIGRKLHGHHVLRRGLSSSASTREGATASGLSGLFTKEQRDTLGEVQELASRTRKLAREIGRVAIKEESLLSDIARLKDDESSSPPPSLFTVVLCGEFNGGKSTLVNALLGVELLDSGVLPTTDKITIVLADDDGQENGSISGVDSRKKIVDSATKRLCLLPSSNYPLLEDLAVVDTPGSNACLSLEHTSTTLKILHDADLILFVTSADRPFGESEKEILASIKSYRKRVALVINKMDILERQQGECHGDESKQQVEDYVVEHASEYLGARPVVIPVSARDALSFKLLGGGGGSLWRRSNFESLEKYLSETLTAKAKIKTKLLNPLGVSEGILKECRGELLRRAEDLEIDVITLKLLTGNLDMWQKEIETAVIRQCLDDVKRALQRRAEVASGVVNSLSLIDKLQLGLGFGRQPFEIAWQEQMSRPPVNDEIQSILERHIKSLLSRAEHQASTTIEYLGKRPAIVNPSHGVNRMIGTVRKANFREEPLKSEKTIEMVTSSLPVDSESSRALYLSLVRTSFLSVFLSAGSVLVPGYLVISGNLHVDNAVAYGASCAALGGVSLPLGNYLTVRSFEKQWKTTQICELETLLRDFMDYVRSELDESIAPYSRFVRSHGDTIRVSNEQLDDCIAISTSLRSKINKVCK